ATRPALRPQAEQPSPAKAAKNFLSRRGAQRALHRSPPRAARCIPNSTAATTVRRALVPTMIRASTDRPLPVAPDDTRSNCTPPAPAPPPCSCPCSSVFHPWLLSSPFLRAVKELHRPTRPVPLPI